jgi:hypothetical protein
MGAAPAFSVIGVSNTAAGAGDTEDARYNTSVQYRTRVGPLRLAARVRGVPALDRRPHNFCKNFNRLIPFKPVKPLRLRLASIGRMAEISPQE